MDLAFWRDVSLFYLLLMQIVVTLLTVVILYFVVRGAIIARRRVTQGVKLAQYYTGIVRDQSSKFADKAAEPLVRAHAEAEREITVARSLIPYRQSTTLQTNHTPQTNQAKE